MAGLHSRLSGDDNISSNLVHAAFILRASGVFNDATILAALNNSIDTNLAGDELTDLSNIGAAMDSEVGTVDKIVYAEKLRAVLIACVEANLSDANFRSILGVS